MSNIISIDPEIMGGTPVFAGTRVPITTLFDYLAEVDDQNSVADFLEDFPSVQRETAVGVLELARLKPRTYLKIGV